MSSIFAATLFEVLVKKFKLSNEKLAEDVTPILRLLPPPLFLGKSVGLRDHHAFLVALGGSLFKFREFDRFY
jgi:hypothetical protein